MSTIRANCPTCGDIELRVRDVLVNVCALSPYAWYSFACGCGEAVARPAEPRIVDLLITAGVRMVAVGYPAEVGEPHAGGRVSLDELLDFVLGDADEALKKECIK